MTDNPTSGTRFAQNQDAKNKSRKAELKASQPERDAWEKAWEKKAGKMMRGSVKNEHTPTA